MGVFILHQGGRRGRKDRDSVFSLGRGGGGGWWQGRKCALWICSLCCRRGGLGRMPTCN